MQLKKKLLICLLLLASGTNLFSQRYLNEVFSSVDISPSIIYGENINTITGSPNAWDLFLDVYQPQGDTAAARPLVLVAHDGLFLPPPINGRCNGTRNDSAVVEICKRFARRGFVAAAIDYRLGWNPVGNQNERVNGFINSIYRGIQDVRTAVRFFRKDAATNNSFKIDSTRIVAGGLGTGGYLSLGAAYLNQYQEISIPKLISPITQTPYIDTALVGNLEATNSRPLCISNHAGFSSELNAVFNLSGGIVDSSWIQAGEPIAISMHCPSDPFAPFSFGAVIVPFTGDFIINVSGSKDVQSLNNSLGLNASFPSGLSDPYTLIADNKNQGLDGLFPAVTSFPSESTPWDWWDTTACANNQAPLQANPDMSATKGRKYLDTLMGYAIPRLVCALNLSSACALVGQEPKLKQPHTTLYPNPARRSFFIQSEQKGDLLQTVEIFDAKGQQVQLSTNLSQQKIKVNSDNFKPGIYLIRVKTNTGTSIHKMLLKQ